MVGEAGNGGTNLDAIRRSRVLEQEEWSPYDPPKPRLVHRDLRDQTHRLRTCITTWARVYRLSINNGDFEIAADRIPGPYPERRGSVKTPCT